MSTKHDSRLWHLVLFGVLLTLVLLADCGDHRKSDTASPPETTPESASFAVPGGTEPKGILDVPVEEMRDWLHSSYRLQPDHRFVRAISIIHEFLTGEKEQKITLNFKEDKWVLTLNEMEVGAIPELADFSDMLAALQKWSQTLMTKYPLHFKADTDHAELNSIETHHQNFLAPELMKALKRIDAQWQKGNLTREYLRKAAQLLVLLTFQHLDSIEIGDELPARAFAMLAIASEATGSRLVREECLLAWSLDYTAHARSLTELLEQTDPLRHFITRNDKELYNTVISRQATQESCYLWLTRLAMKHDFVLWEYWLQKSFPQAMASLPIMKTMVISEHFAVSREASRALPHLVMLAIGQENRPDDALDGLLKGVPEDASDKVMLLLRTKIKEALGIEEGSLVDRFNEEQIILEKTLHGPFLDSRTGQAWFRAYFYSALYTLGIHYLDQLACVEASRQFSQELGPSGKGLALQFSNWYAHLATFAGGKADHTMLHNDIRTLDLVGAPALWRSFEELKDTLPMGDPALLQSARLLGQRLDSRPNHRYYLAHMAKWYILDLKLAEKMFASLVHVDTSKFQHIHPYYYVLRDDMEGLKKMLSESELHPRTRARIVDYLAQSDIISPAYLRTEFERIIEEEPVDWNAWSPFIKFLQASGQYEHARHYLEKWLRQNKQEKGFPYIFARISLARNFYLEGRYKEGLAAIEPVIDSEQRGAMQWAALLYAKLGRTGEAETMFQRIGQRYPDIVEVLGYRLQFHWQRAEYSRAAELIASFPHTIKEFEWRNEIGDRFYEVFRDKPVEEAVTAFREMTKLPHIKPEYLIQICAQVYHSGDPERAFKMQEIMRSNHVMNDLTLKTNAYLYLKHWKNEEEARDWLREIIPEKFYQPLSQVAFDLNCYELLWDFIPDDPPPGECKDCVWLMRACAWLKTMPHNHNTERWQAIKNYFAGTKDEFYFQLGRYMVDLSTESDVLRHVNDARKRCEIGYYFGLKAHSAGNLPLAHDWYRVSIETGRKNTSTYIWSYRQLHAWNVKDKSLSQLK